MPVNLDSVPQSVNTGDASSPQLSRNSRTFLQKKLERRAKKDNNGGSDATVKYQKRSLQCLKRFNCPVCRMQGSVHIEMNTKERQAVLTCSYCIRLKPRPIDLPYPFTTSFLPKLENRADVFFKFNELYRKLELQTSSVDCFEAGAPDMNTDGQSLGGGVLALAGLESESVVGENDNNEYKRAVGYEGEAYDTEENENADKEAEEGTTGDDREVEDVNAFFDDSD